LNFARYGYRKVAGLLRQAGWIINDKRVERIWRREGLKVPNKQPKRGRLWLADGSCIRLRPQHRNHVWSYDFVEDRTHDGRRYRMPHDRDRVGRGTTAGHRHEPGPPTAWAFCFSYNAPTRLTGKHRLF
jgi:putative transposase